MLKMWTKAQSLRKADAALGAEQHGAAKICPAGFVDVVRRQFPKRAFQATRRAGVIDPTVDDSEPRDGISHERLSLAWRGHIARHAIHLGSGHIESKLPQRCFEKVTVTSADDHTVSGEQELSCHCQAKPADPPVTTTPKGRVAPSSPGFMQFLILRISTNR